MPTLTEVTARARARAHEAGEPLPKRFWRLREKHLGSRPVIVAAADARSGRLLLDREPATPDELMGLVFEPKEPVEVPVVAFDDRRDMRRFASRWLRSENPSTRAAGRVMKMAATLELAQVFVSAVTAAQETFWMPEGLDESRLEDWAEVLDVDVEDATFSVLGRVASAPAIDRIAAGTKFPHPASGLTPVAKKLMLDELKVLRASRYPGSKASVSAYGRLTARQALLKQVSVDDPLLREVCLADGSAFAAAELEAGIEEDVIEVVTESGLRFKEASEVRLFTSVGQGQVLSWSRQCTVLSIQAEQDCLRVELRLSGSLTAASVARTKLLRLAATGERFWLGEQPFMAAPAAVTNPRWSSRRLGAGPKRVREVPADILAAAQ